MNAVKPVYNRSTKRYDVETVANADPLMAYDGWLVFDNAANALAAILAGRLLQGWKETKKQAVIDYLKQAKGN